jgi:myo-inositol catabolism protein IolC
MTTPPSWRPTHTDPLFILAMDHRESFGRTLFGVVDDHPTAAQLQRMRGAKATIFAGLEQAAGRLTSGRAGVLVDEKLGQSVIDDARRSAMALAVPIEASGHDWFTLEWGDAWREHVERLRPDYAKILVRDNPAYDASERFAQLARLADVSGTLHAIGVPLLYELLVPATADQLAQVSGDADRYDRDVRPTLVAEVIAANQQAGVEPTLWKVEGLETADAAADVAAAARAGGRDADLIVLGRDAPADRLDHWLEVASEVEAFVGFAIGRSIWQDPIAARNDGTLDDAGAAARIADRYLQFTRAWTAG